VAFFYDFLCAFARAAAVAAFEDGTGGDNIIE
jgi:hypothetical protein